MKSERIVVLTAEQATKAALPKYNPAPTGLAGVGPQKSIKDFDRNRLKRELRKELNNDYH